MPPCSSPDTSTDLALSQSASASSEEGGALFLCPQSSEGAPRICLETLFHIYSISLHAFEFFVHISSTSRPSCASCTGYLASYTVDGDDVTRWGSQFVDPSWLSIDFGQEQSLCSVSILWEGAFGSAYELQVGTTSAPHLSCASHSSD